MNASTYSEYQKIKLFSNLDGMRCLSISYVVWHHTAGKSWSFFPMLNRGFLGVDIFFVISGFLIVTLLLREKQKTKNISLKKFYIRRFLRIFPVYYALLLTISLYYLFLKPESPTKPLFFEDLPYYALYISNWHQSATFMNISWSLATEEQFYLAWPLVQKYFFNLSLFFLFIFLVINQAINFGILSLFLSPDRVTYLESLEIIQCTYTPICFGIILAYVLHNQTSFERCFYLLGNRWSSLVCCGLFLCAVNFPGDDVQGWKRMIIQLTITFFIGSVVVKEKNVFHKFLNLSLVKRIGVVSYGMYLFHLIIAGLMIKILESMNMENKISLFFGTLFITYLFSEISYRYFETPFLNLKKHFEATS